MSAIDDFDFLFGCWSVRHRRLRSRGCGCTVWDEFTGTAETRPLLGGLCNIEEHLIAGADCSGVALRTFDRATQLWRIFWVSKRDGVLQAPVHGRFVGAIGEFDGRDVDCGRLVHVRFLWNRGDAQAPRWEQSFSYDAGSSWELNWVMEFKR